MNVHSRSRRFRLLCLFVLSFLLLVVQVRAQDDDEDYDSPGDGKEFASLNVQIDEHGAAKVTFALALEPDKTAAVKQSLSDALGFPLQIDSERSSTLTKEAQFTWWFLQAHNDHAFQQQGLVTGGQMNLSPLLSALRQAEVRQLSLTILFEGKVRNLHVAGASKLLMPDIDRYGDMKGYTLPELYTLRIKTDAPAPPIEVSWGYRPADLLLQLTPLFLFMLLPLLLTLWMGRSVLRMKEADPLTIWGRYFRYLYWLIGGIWLGWLPVYSWANIPELLSMTGAHGLLFEALGLMLYFLPPMLVLSLCHMLSRKVYAQVRGAEWSPRDVIRKAILTNAVSLMPLFFFVLALNMFAAKSVYAGLLISLAFLCWAVFARFASKAFNLNTYAVESGELRDRIFALAERAGVRLKQIYVLPEGQGQLSNAFARSDNAVMLTASLLRHLSKREVDAIMAHEIGHLKEKHPQTRGRVTVIVIVVANFICLTLSSVIKLQRWTPALFSLSIAAAMLVVHFLSRSNERHADAIAVNLTGDPEAFITGLAKISRLNLMPLHAGGGWSESLDTHPQTQRRLQDVAGCSGISPQRLQELLGATQTAEERYSLALPDKVEERVFSTAFKSKYIFRISWALIGVVVGTPVLLALLAAFLNPPGLFKWAAFIAGLCLTFALYQLFRNFAAFWGYTSLEQRLRAKVKRNGIDEAARDGLFVGFAPADEPRSYENYVFWDAGLLQLTAEQICYVGEETRFALRREQIVDIYLGDSQPLWLRQQHLYIRWRDEEHGASGTFYLVTAGAHSLLRARREVKALHQQLQGWLTGAATHADAAPPLSSLTSPDYGVVTNQRMSDRFTLRTFLLSTFQLTGFTLLLSLGARLPLWGMGYAWGIVVGICLLDQLPKLFQRSAEKTAHPSPTDEHSAEMRTRPSGTWAESET